VSSRMPQQIAVAFALSAFTVSIAVGLMSAVPPTTILLRSIVVLLVSATIGRVLGRVALVAVNEHLTTTTKNNPIPEAIHIPTGPTPGGVGEVEIID